MSGPATPGLESKNLNGYHEEDEADLVDAQLESEALERELASLQRKATGARRSESSELEAENAELRRELEALQAARRSFTESPPAALTALEAENESLRQELAALQSSQAKGDQTFSVDSENASPTSLDPPFADYQTALEEKLQAEQQIAELQTEQIALLERAAEQDFAVQKLQSEAAQREEELAALSHELESTKLDLEAAKIELQKSNLKFESLNLELESTRLERDQALAKLPDAQKDSAASSVHDDQTAAWIAKLEERMAHLQQRLETAENEGELEILQLEAINSEQRTLIERLQSELAASSDAQPSDVFAKNYSDSSSHFPSRPMSAEPSASSRRIGRSFSDSRPVRPRSASVTSKAARGSISPSRTGRASEVITETETSDMVRMIQSLQEENHWLQRCLANSRVKHPSVDSELSDPEGQARWTKLRAAERAAQEEMNIVLQTLRDEGVQPDANGYKHILHLWKTREAIIEQLQMLKTQHKILQSEANVMKSLLDQYSQESSPAAVETVRKELDELQSQLGHMQQALASSQQRRNMDARDREAHNTRQDELVRLLKAQQAAELHQLTTEKNQADATAANLRRDVSLALSRVSNLENELSQAQDDLNEAREENKEQRAVYDENLLKLQSTLLASKERAAQLDSEVAHLRQAVSDSAKHLEDERSRLMKEVAEIKQTGHGEVQFVRVEAERAKQHLEAHHERIIKDLQAEAQRVRDEHARVRSELLSQNDALKQTWQEETAKLRKEYAAHQSAQQASNERSVEQLRADLRKEKDARTAEVNSLIAEKTKVAQELQFTTDSLRALQHATSAKYREFVNAVRAHEQDSGSVEPSALSAQPDVTVEESLVRMVAAYERTLLDLKAASKAMALQTTEHSAALRTAEARHKEDVARLTADFKASLASQERTIKLLQENCDTTTKHHVEAKDDLRSQFEHTIELLREDSNRLRTEHATQLAATEERHRVSSNTISHELKQLQAMHSQEVRQLMEAKSLLEQDLARTKESLQTISKALEAKHEELLTFHKQFDQELVTMKQIIAKEKEEAQAHQTQEAQQKSVEVNALQQRILNLVEENKHAAGQIAAFTAQIESLTQQNREQSQAHQQQLELLTREQARQSEVLQAQTSNQIVEKERALRLLQEATAKTANESDQNRKDMAVQHAATIELLRHEIDELKTAHENSIHRLTQQHTSAIEEKQQTFTAVTEIQNKEIKQLRLDLAKYMQEAATVTETVAQLNHTLLLKENEIAELEDQVENERNALRQTIVSEKEAQRSIVEREQESKQQTVSSLQQELLRVTVQFEKTSTSLQAASEQVKSLQTENKQLRADHIQKIQELGNAQRDELAALQTDHLNRSREKDEALKQLQDSSEKHLHEQRQANKAAQEQLQQTIQQARTDLAQVRDQAKRELQELNTKHESTLAEARAELAHHRSEHSKALRDLQEEKQKLLQDASALNENLRSLSRALEEKRIETVRLQDALDNQAAEMTTSRVQDRELLQTAQNREAEEKRRMQAMYSEKIETLSNQNEKTLAALKAAQDQITSLRFDNAQLTKDRSEENKANMMTTKHISDQLKQTQLDMAQQMAKAESEISNLKKAVEDENRAKMAQIAEYHELETKLASLTAQLAALDEKGQSLREAVESAFTAFSRIRDSHAVGVERNPVNQLNHMLEQHRRKQDALEASEKQLQTVQKHLGEYSSRVMSLDGQVQELQKLKALAESDHRNAKEVNSALTSRCDYLSERLLALEREKKEYEQKLTETTDALSKHSEASAATQARLNALVESLRGQVESLTQTNNKLTADASKQIAGFEEENRRLLGLLNDKQKQTEAILDECRSIREDRSQKTAALAGETRLRAELESQRDRLQVQNANLAAENKQTREELIKHEARGHQLEDEFARVQREAQNLQSNLAETQEHVQLLTAKVAELDAKRGSAELRANDLQHQLEQTQADLERTENALTQEQAERHREHREATRLAADVDKLQASIRESNADKQQLSKSQRDLQATSTRALAKKEDENARLQQTVQDMQAIIQLEKDKNAQLKQQIDEARLNVQDLKAKLEAHKQLAGDLKAELESCRSELDDARIEGDQTRVKLNEEVATLKSQLNLEKKSAGNSVADVNRQLELVKAKLARETEALQTEEATTRRLRDENASTQRQLDQLREERDSIARRQTQLQSALDERERDANQLRRENSSLVEDLERSKSARKNLEERMRQDQARTLADIQRQIAQPPQPERSRSPSKFLGSSASADARLASLDSKLRDLGLDRPQDSLAAQNTPLRFTSRY